MGRPVVRLLGAFSLETAKGVVLFPARKVEALFAYLLLVRRPVARDRLGGILWPDADEEMARKNLRTALWRLRKVLRAVPELRLSSDDRAISIECDQADVDVAKFESLVESLNTVPAERRFDVMNEALSLYRGDLLDGLSEDWCEESRRQLRGLYARLLKHAVNAHKTTGDFRAAVAHAQNLVGVDPLDEDGHRELMLLHHLSGDREAALSQFGKLRVVLQEELGVQPSAATIELWQFIRSQSQRALPAGALVASFGTSGGEAVRVPMVGRNSQFAALVSLVEEVAQGQGRAVLVSGEPGIGKSTLVEALAIEAGLRGFEVLQGQCPDLQDPSPYQVFVQALWPRMTIAERQAGEPRTPLKVLIQSLGPREVPEESPNQTAQAGVFDSAIVNETLLSLLAGSYATRPTVLILEDMHRVDRASANLLTALLGRSRRSKLLVVVTVRSGESTTDKLRSSLLASGALEMSLEPLNQIDVAELMRNLLVSKYVPDDVVGYVRERTSGVPLLILEFVRLLQAEGFLTRDRFNRLTLDPRAHNARLTALPSRVNEVIRRRFELLDSVSRKALTLAAILGPGINFDQFQELTGLPEDDFVECTDRLVAARLIREASDGFQFVHESIRLVAISSENKTHLRRLHTKVARFLERTTPWCTEDLSWHFEESGDVEKAMSYAEASGDKARDVYANSNAVEWFSKALQLLDKCGRSRRSSIRRVGLLRKRQEVLELLGDRRGQAADIDAIHSTASDLQDRNLLAEALCLRANLLIRANMSQRAFDSIRHAIRLFCSVGDLSGEGRARETAGLAYLNVRRYDLARFEFKGALSALRRAKDRAGEARCLVHLGTVLGFGNHNTTAIRYFDKADVLFKELEDVRSRAFTWLQKGTLYRFLGRVEASQSLLLSGLDMMRRIGDRVGEARGLSQLACTHACMGRLREAIHESERALQIARRTRDVRAEIVILNNAAYGVFRLVGAFDRAERYVVRAMTLVLEAGGIENAATYADTMTSIFLGRGDHQAALLWAKLSHFLCGTGDLRKTWIGIDVRFRLGLVMLETGHYADALRLLQGARAKLSACKESAHELLVVTQLARIHLLRRDLAKALSCANDMASLLRRLDGVEDVQKVHWVRYEVLIAAHKYAAARRALGKAYESMLGQASTLKGPMRRRYLEMEANMRIADAITLGMASGSAPVVDKGRLKETLRADDLTGGTKSGNLVDKNRRVAKSRLELIRLLRRNRAVPIRVDRISAGRERLREPSHGGRRRSIRAV